jgi:hypothetical protein
MKHTSDRLSHVGCGSHACCAPEARIKAARPKAAGRDRACAGECGEREQQKRDADFVQQQSTFRDAHGRVTGSARIDRNGVTTFHDAVGRTTSGAAPSTTLPHLPEMATIRSRAAHL